MEGVSEFFKLMITFVIVYGIIFFSISFILWSYDYTDFKTSVIEPIKNWIKKRFR